MTTEIESAGDAEGVRVELNGIELSWWPTARLARMAFSDDNQTPDGADARVVSAQLEQWITGDEPWGFLVDCSSIETAQAGWRNLFSKFFHEQRSASRIAWYGASPHMQVIIRMFVTGLRASGPLIGEPYATEDEARAFLRAQGIPA
ncbi:MAG: hypothetical protein JWL76_496 [Thermoleophilia bacterium]|nr:hypothetical protein [Thermoleophilia bacterium]